MYTRYVMIALSVLALSACQTATDGGTTGTGKTLAEKEAVAATETTGTKSVPLTETTAPNKSASGSDVETEDLASLKAQLNALSGDISRIRGDLTDGSIEAKSAMPDTQTSTPRALVTDKIIDIPDSKEELIKANLMSIQGVRVGAHSDKTRLVFDLSQNPAREPQIDLSGNTLKIKVFDAKWTDGNTVLASQTKMLGVSSVTSERDDVVATITLHNAATLKSHMVLPPVEIGGPFRLVVDLSPSN